MQWLDGFHLYLFDFDGLLVDTEPLHFKAFKQMLAANNCDSQLSYANYLELAHANTIDLRDHTYASFNLLYKEKPDWEVLRQEKAIIYLGLLKTEELKLLPGVEKVLTILEAKGVKRCVVTNSTHEQVQLIQLKLPLLTSIPHWICREDYCLPKPDPEGYLLAISRLAQPGDRIVGFEDSPKGLKALQEASVEAVLITTRKERAKDCICFDSFEILVDNLC